MSDTDELAHTRGADGHGEAAAPERPTVAVILNPAAGRGSGHRAAAELDRLFSQRCAGQRGRWRLFATAGPGDARRLAAEAAASGFDVVAAAGGDGTCGEVVNGIIGTAARLGIIPLGTGNDLARGLGLTGSIERSVAALVDGEARPLDAGYVAGRWFVNIAGCGFDAAVADRVNRGFRLLRGRAAYLAAIVQCLMTYRSAHLTLTVDGTEREMDALLCSVANSASYGGGMRVAPDAELDDGLFDIVLIARAGRLEFLRALPRVYRGAHVDHPKVTIFRGARVRVEADRPLGILIDGEVVGTTPAEFVIRRHALQVMVPANGRTDT